VVDYVSPSAMRSSAPAGLGVAAFGGTYRGREGSAKGRDRAGRNAVHRLPGCSRAAHVMIALCRATGLPTRYVSGHLLGEGGTHAWVEVIVADANAARAVALDPCNGCRVGANYLTVATGRDYTDVAPTSGTYLGTARGNLTATKQVDIALP
jgi:hypothetical protein